MYVSESSDTTGVRTVMERYIDATYRADVATLRSLFHPQATMTGYLGGELILGGPESFFADIGGRPSMAEAGDPYKGEIVATHASGYTGSAVIEQSGFFGAGYFVDYFHLVKIDGEWLIISKTFETL
jgi:hypothetical protein